MLAVLISIFIILAIALPLLSIAWLWKGKFTSRVDWIVRVLAAASIVVFFDLAGPWAFASIWLKYVVKALFVAAALWTFPRLEERAIFSKRNSNGRVSYRPRIIIIAVFLLLDVLAIKGKFHKENPVDLAFPMKDGRYYAIQGGASPLLNPFHRSEKSEGYAVDIVKLNLIGNRAGGLFPSELPSYKIFGEVLYSPCSGKVTFAADGVPDNAPHEVNENNPAGNHIILECKDASILLAHLLNGSVKVAKGQYVKENQVIGRVGNSGMTFEPHLHISAHKAGEPDKAVPLTFKGEYLVMNKGIRN